MPANAGRCLHAREGKVYSKFGLFLVKRSTNTNNEALIKPLIPASSRGGFGLCPDACFIISEERAQCQSCQPNSHFKTGAVFPARVKKGAQVITDNRPSKVLVWTAESHQQNFIKTKECKHVKNAQRATQTHEHKSRSYRNILAQKHSYMCQMDIAKVAQKCF